VGVGAARARAARAPIPAPGDERLVAFEALADDAGPAPDARLDEPLVIEAGALERALGRLRLEERETLFLHAVVGHTAAELAALTGRPRGSVLSSLHRAKRKLRDLLEPHRRVKP
jgi:DNA-directed RNA polymerase specialized sigma24 family protein